MTKKELLKLLDLDSILKHMYSDLYERYYEKLSDMLMMIDDGNTKITDLPSLEDIKEKNDFDNFIRSSSKDEIERKLSEIVVEVRYWIKNYKNKEITNAENNAIDTINAGRHTGMIVFTVIIILFALVAIAFQIVSMCVDFEHADKISEAFAMADFLVGVIGFVIERFSDIKKDKVRGYAKEGRDTGDVKGTITKIDNSINQCGFFNIGKIDKRTVINNYSSGYDKSKKRNTKDESDEDDD